MLHAAFVRSPHAHARVLRIDAAAARRREGVVAVYTAADLGDYWRPGPLLVPPPPIDGHRVQRAHPGAAGQGQGAACRRAGGARDCREPLPGRGRRWPTSSSTTSRCRRSSTSKRHSLPGAACVHDDLGSNVAARVRQTKGNYAAAAKHADRIIRRRFHYDRGASSPIETRGVVAQWDAKGDQLTVWDTTQAPVVIRNGLAAMLGLSERQVRVIAPFIGGGFGPKIMMFYPEEVLVPWAAMQLNRPVKWIEDRARALRRHHARARPDPRRRDRRSPRDGRILGVKDVFLHDTGAYDPYGLTVPINSQCTLLGPYRDAELRQRVHRGLHQQADRHAVSRRRPPARRVRHGAAARHRGARARPRPRRDPPPQFHSARRVPLQQRDHLPGFRAARIRQRQLRARCSTRRWS